MKVDIQLLNLFDDLAYSLKNQNFRSSASLRLKFYSPEDIMHQNTSNKQKVGKVEVNRLRNATIGNTWTSVAFQESVKFGEKVMEVYERIKNKEKKRLKTIFKKFVEKCSN